MTDSSAAAPPTTTRPLGLAFTASGSEYFRIWIVNLLLIIVTLGLYLPFAKARRLRYFYDNTLVDGQPLAFHGDPWKMFKGYLLMLALFGAYSVSGYVSSWLSLVVFGVLAGLWPALWRSSLRFRLGNTSWRGVRFGFAGDVAGAYRAMLPLAVPSFAILVLNAVAMNGVDASDKQAVNEAMKSVLVWNGVAMVGLMAMLPWSSTQIRRYQHNGYAYAQESARMPLRAATVYVTALVTLGMVLLAAVVMVPAIAAAFSALMAVGPQLSSPDMGTRIIGIALAGVVVVTILMAYMAMLFVGQAWFSARLQNQCWSATRSQQLVFRSTLSPRKLAVLMLKNLFLTVLTFGLYRPFAVVQVMKLRWLAMEVELEGSMDDWAALGLRANQGASGEMSGDFFGIDVGL